MTRKVCLFEDCGNYTKGRGWKVCNTHSSTNALQSEIERLRSYHPEGAWRALRHGHVQRLFRLVSELDNRAEPLKGANVEVTARSRSHGLGDGIVVLGDEHNDVGYQPAVPGYAVSSYADSGRLGAALAQVKAAADKIEDIADTKHTRKPKPGRRCGSRKCPKPNVRQPVDNKFCGYCGREFDA